MTYSIIVIGGGLSGLTCAKRLCDFYSNSCTPAQITVCEGRARVGGRLLSNSGIDLGAAWCWPANDRALLALATEVGVSQEKQVAKGTAMIFSNGNSSEIGNDMSPSGPGSHRFAGGAMTIAVHLVDQLKKRENFHLHLNCRVKRIVDSDGVVQVEYVDTDNTARSLVAHVIVLALPPELASNTITYSPPLDPRKVQAMKDTPTWMANTGKVVFRYSNRFWTRDGKSGTAFSNSGPLQQVWDNSTEDGKVHALAGFVFGEDLKYLENEQTVRSSPIMEQLVSLFGSEAASPEQIIFKSWRTDEFTCSAPIREQGSVPYGHSSVVSAAYKGKLIFAGTETAANEHGHMNGAVLAGERAAKEVVKLLSSRV